MGQVKPSRAEPAHVYGRAHYYLDQLCCEDAITLYKQRFLKLSLSTVVCSSVQCVVLCCVCVSW